jgi:hypothetical protein
MDILFDKAENVSSITINRTQGGGVTPPTSIRSDPIKDPEPLVNQIYNLRKASKIVTRLVKRLMLKVSITLDEDENAAMEYINRQ